MKKTYRADAPQKKRVRYMMMGGALLAGEHAPIYIHPKTRLKAPPKGGSAVANAGSLFDIGEGAVSLGLNVMFAPDRTATRVRRGFEREYDRAKKETRQGILEPVFFGITEDEITKKHARERAYRHEKMIHDPNYENIMKRERKYNPQDIQPNYIPTGRREPKGDQDIRTSYEIKKRVSNLVPDLKPSNNFFKEKGVTKSSFPDFDNINLTHSVKKSSYPKLSTGSTGIYFPDETIKRPRKSKKGGK